MAFSLRSRAGRAPAPAARRAAAARGAAAARRAGAEDTSEANATLNGRDRPELPVPPEDVMEMFREAQQSIMDLNHSRLAALEELQLARSHIAELEERLETAEAVAQDATAEVAEVLAAEAALPEAEEEEEPAAAAAVAGAIVLKYPTSWSPAFIHYKVEGGEWTDPPGVRMEAGGEGVQTVALEGAGVEFVFTNGEGKWDKPVSGKNYGIAGPGEYVVSDGKVVSSAAE